MQRHAPGQWNSPAVEEALVDPPAGFGLDRYYREEREHVVYCRRANAESAVNVAGDHRPDSAASLQIRAYLVVKAWRGKAA